MSHINALEPVIRRSSGCTRPSESRGMLVWNRLRIDPNDGSPVLDYRIENGCVEQRTLRTATNEEQWQRLTPEQLASYVMANTVVAHWVSRRLGVRSLLRACTQNSSHASNPVHEGHAHPREVDDASSAGEGVSQDNSARSGSVVISVLSSVPKLPNEVTSRDVSCLSANVSD